MADEVLRIRILDALAADIASIRKVDGYTHDLNPDCVFWGRGIFGDKDPLPMISILEVPIPLDQVVPPPDSSYSSGTWELLIQGFVKDDAKQPTRPAHRLMADVKKKLALTKRTNRDFELFGMGNHVTDIRIGAGVVRPPDEVSSKAYFWLNLSLDIVEDLSNPFED
jgi:hypothetical protein